MTEGPLRMATLGDAPQLIDLWALLFDEGEAAGRWRPHALEWFERSVHDTGNARVPVVAVGATVVAAAVGTLELGVPNPYCLTGRSVRLANVITLPEHRGRGHATRLTQDVVNWARTIDADRVDLSATPAGQRLYETLGFALTSAPRMKLDLRGGA